MSSDPGAGTVKKCTTQYFHWPVFTTKENPGIYSGVSHGELKTNYRLVNVAEAATLAVGIPMFKPPVALAV